MKVLVTGANGQLGFDLVRVLSELNIDNKGIDILDLDITDSDAVNSYIDIFKPTHIIHCAAYTAVDKAEENKETCYIINVLGTRYLSEAARRNNAEFLYISTDYVFDGNGEVPFNTNSKPNPINYYGETKYLGEQEVIKHLEKYYIVRISWVFGLNGKNFVNTMLKLSDSKKDLRVVADQIGSPTYTFDLSYALVDLIKTQRYGIYHLTNDGYCSWYDFASEIFKQSGKEVKVNPINTEEYPTMAKRPKNSRMEKTDLKLRPWQEALKHYLENNKFYLVIGGGGFIGSKLSEKLTELGKNVIAYDRDFTNLENVKNPNIIYIEGELKDIKKIENIMSKYNVVKVIHLVSSLIPSSTSDDYQREINDVFLPTLNLLNLMSSFKIKEIVYFSSGGTIYGNYKTSSYIETDELKPINFYGLSKLMIEEAIKLYSRISEINYLIVRPSNPFDSSQKYNKNQGLITSIMHKLIKKEQIDVFGDGSIVRDYIPLDVMIDWISRLIEGEKYNEIYNISSGNGCSIQDVINKIEIITNQSTVINYVESRSVDAKYIVLNNSKLLNTIKVDDYNFEDYLKKMYLQVKNRVSSND